MFKPSYLAFVILTGVALTTATLFISGCGDGDGSGGGSAIRIQGAGATFPDPLYKRWVGEYDEVAADVRVDYSAIGSGGGIRRITDKTVDFGASDAPLDDGEIEKMGGPEAIIQFPSVAGSVVLTYNLPMVKGDIRLTGDLIAKIYLGEVAKWNDPALVALNPGINLPDLPITPIYRTDGSGTTFVFTNYLVTQSVDFQSKVGGAKQVPWPFGLGGKGNKGVTAAVDQTPGSIGYVEYGFAAQNKLPFALVQNRDGNFIRSSPETVKAAGAGAAGTMTGQVLKANIWDQPGADAYPIAAFTYIIVYVDLKNVSDKAKAQALVDFLWWATHDGQSFAAEMDYAPLAEAVQAKVEAAMMKLTYKGEALRVGPASDPTPAPAPAGATTAPATTSNQTSAESSGE